MSLKPTILSAVALVLIATTPALAEQPVKIKGQLKLQHLGFYPEMKAEFVIKVNKSNFLISVKSDPSARGFESEVGIDVGEVKEDFRWKKARRFTLRADPATFGAFLNLLESYSEPALLDCLMPSKTARSCALKEFRLISPAE